MTGKDKNNHSTSAATAKQANEQNAKKQQTQQQQQQQKQQQQQGIKKNKEHISEADTLAVEHNKNNNNSAKKHENITRKEAVNNNNNNSDNSSHPFLGKEVRVELTDGRVEIGILVAYEGSGDMLLQNVLEQRTYKDGVKTERAQTLLAIPFKYVAHIYRRLPEHEPVTNIFMSRQNVDVPDEVNKNSEHKNTIAVA